MKTTHKVTDARTSIAKRHETTDDKRPQPEEAKDSKEAKEKVSQDHSVPTQSGPKKFGIYPKFLNRINIDGTIHQTFQNILQGNFKIVTAPRATANTVTRARQIRG